MATSRQDGHVSRCATENSGGTATRCWVAVRCIGQCTATQRRVTVPPAGDERTAATIARRRTADG